MLHHGKFLALAAGLLTGTAATAQIGPEIAYAKGGGRAEVYLINDDSSGRKLLYRGPSRSEIFHVDIKPGGGELAIEEHVQSKSGSEVGLTSTIKIFNYDAGGSIVVGSVRTLELDCLSGSIDYHPTDGSLLYRGCTAPIRVMRLNTSTLVSSELGLPHNAFVATWLDSTNLLYYVSSSAHATDGAKFWKFQLGSAAPTLVVSSSSPGSLDPSSSAATVLVSGFSEIRQIDIAAQQISLFQPGDKGHFSPNNERVLYITGTGGGRYMLIRQTDGTGSPTNLAGKGNYTALDWRN